MADFEKLWNAHPTRVDNDLPCKDPAGKPHFENQCAIRMGIALEEGGVNTKQWGLERCWQHKTHILRAQELADALWHHPFPGLGRREVYPGKTGFDDISQRTGLIFIRNYWGDGDTLSGDHIDLWNGLRLTKFNSVFRLALPLHWFGAGSDMKQAQQLWFWPFPAGQPKYVPPPEEDDWDNDY